MKKRGINPNKMNPVSLLKRVIRTDAAGSFAPELIHRLMDRNPVTSKYILKTVVTRMME